MLLLGVYTLAQGAEGEHDGLVAVGTFTFAVVIVGIVWPIIALRKVEVNAEKTTRHATVGDRIALGLQITGRVSRLEVRLLNPPGEWRRTLAPGTGELIHIRDRRGVFRIVRVEIRSGGPLGIFLRRRTLWIRLPTAVSVAATGPDRLHAVDPADRQRRHATRRDPRLPAGDAVPRGAALRTG